MNSNLMIETWRCKRCDNTSCESYSPTTRKCKACGALHEGDKVIIEHVKRVVPLKKSLFKTLIRKLSGRT